MATTPRISLAPPRPNGPNLGTALTVASPPPSPVHGMSPTLTPMSPDESSRRASDALVPPSVVSPRSTAVGG